MPSLLLPEMLDPVWARNDYPKTLPNLAAWYDASDLSTITIATGVSQWADKGGLGRHLKQATGANQPTYANGVLTFDGTNDYLKADAFTLAQPITVYFVGSQVTWTNTDTLFDGDAINTLRFYQFNSANNVIVYAGNTPTALTTMPLAQAVVFSAVVNSAASSMRLNRNAALSPVNMGALSAGGFTLGARADSAAPGNITASEVIIFAAAHDQQQQDRVIQYLGRKWGIAVPA